MGGQYCTDWRWSLRSAVSWMEEMSYLLVVTSDTSPNLEVSGTHRIGSSVIVFIENEYQ